MRFALAGKLLRAGGPGPDPIGTGPLARIRAPWRRPAMSVVPGEKVGGARQGNRNVDAAGLTREVDAVEGLGAHLASCYFSVAIIASISPQSRAEGACPARSSTALIAS